MMAFFFIDPAHLRRRLDHRILAADIIDAHGHLHRIFHPHEEYPDKAEPGFTITISAPSSTSIKRLLDRLQPVGRVHLIGLFIPKPRRRIQRIP